jgi:hypothetical protein
MPLHVQKQITHYNEMNDQIFNIDINIDIDIDIDMNI